MPSILLLAGEPSGDRYGGALADELRRRIDPVELSGIGGPRMAEQGVELEAKLDELAVMGLVEVLPRLGFFRRLERSLRRKLDRGVIDLVVAIDYPGLNLRMVRAAHRAGVPVIYYIPPKVWAWRRKRAAVLARAASHVAVIFPFEVDVWRRAGARVSYVGNPLLDRLPCHHDDAAFRARWKLDAEAPILALLPGSRAQEVARHLPVFLDAAARVRARLPSVQPVVARVPSLPARLYGDPGVPTVDDAQGLLAHARAALVKSGTATLEAALAGTPMVVAYRAHPVSWVIARRLVRVPHVSLPNLIASEEVVPELLQARATPGALAERVAPLLEADDPARLGQIERLGRVAASLGGPGAGARVAEIAVGLLDGAA